MLFVLKSNGVFRVSIYPDKQRKALRCIPNHEDERPIRIEHFYIGGSTSRANDGSGSSSHCSLLRYFDRCVVQRITSVNLLIRNKIGQVRFQSKQIYDSKIFHSLKYKVCINYFNDKLEVLNKNVLGQHFEVILSTVS